jgi:hypothetical protein
MREERKRQKEKGRKKKAERKRQKEKGRKKCNKSMVSVIKTPLITWDIAILFKQRC